MKQSSTSTTAFLRQRGLRRTPVRVGVLDLLMGAHRPLSVPEILGKMKGVDSVTLYRTLNTFVREKIVHRVRGEDRSWRYAMGNTAQTAEHRHPHFVCEDCGKVECIEGSEIPGSFVTSLKIPAGYRVSFPEVEPATEDEGEWTLTRPLGELAQEQMGEFIAVEAAAG